MKNLITNNINEFLKYKTNVENLASRSYKAYEHDLQESFLPFLITHNRRVVSEITSLDIEEYLTHIKQRSKTGSVANRNRKLASIKSFFKYLQIKGIAQNIIGDIKPIKNRTKIISYLTETEKEQLLNTVERVATPFYKARDIAILKLFLNTGVRVSELINLQMQDIEFHSKGISYIRIKRKGGNEAQLPINYKTMYAIRAYLAKRKDIETSIYVFLSKNNKQLETNSVYHLVKHYLHKAGIEKRKWGPHILRHTVGVSLRRRGIDIATIQLLLGHKKLETTAIYLNVESQDLVKAVQSL